MTRSAKARPSLLPWLVGVALTAGVVPAAAQGRHHACLAPGGDDDTAALQAELDRCSGATRPCTVTLCAGTFRTNILRVRDFRGTLRGRGPERTILRALPDLPVSQDPGDFFRDDPFGPEPWPYLVQFIEGRARVEDLGILVPAPPPGSDPTTGWYLLGDGPIFELRGALLFSGREPVDFEVRDVRVEAEDPGSDLGTTTFNGMEFGGLLYDRPDGLGAFPVFPAKGHLRLTDSTFDGVLVGTPLAELAAAKVLVARNRYRSTIAVEVIDADRSAIGVLANRWTVSYRGVQLRQNLDGAPSRAAGSLVDVNRGRVAPLFAGLGEGLSLPGPRGRLCRTRRDGASGDGKPLRRSGAGTRPPRAGSRRAAPPDCGSPATASSEGRARASRWTRRTDAASGATRCAGSTPARAPISTSATTPATAWRSWARTTSSTTKASPTG